MIRLFFFAPLWYYIMYIVKLFFALMIIPYKFAERMLIDRWHIREYELTTFEHLYDLTFLSYAHVIEILCLKYYSNYQAASQMRRCLCDRCHKRTCSFNFGRPRDKQWILFTCLIKNLHAMRRYAIKPRSSIKSTIRDRVQKDDKIIMI